MVTALKAVTTPAGQPKVCPNRLRRRLVIQVMMKVRLYPPLRHPSSTVSLTSNPNSRQRLLRPFGLRHYVPRIQMHSHLVEPAMGLNHHNPKLKNPRSCERGFYNLVGRDGLIETAFGLLQPLRGACGVQNACAFCRTCDGSQPPQPKN